VTPVKKAETVRPGYIPCRKYNKPQNIPKRGADPSYHGPEENRTHRHRNKETVIRTKGAGVMDKNELK
jgi:hypothetical protein